jgi:hypothetical protein
MAYTIRRGDRFTGYYRKAGKRLCAGTWNTETEAMYHAIQAEKNGLEKASKANLTLSQFVKDWLAVAELMPITKKGYESILNAYVLPTLGDQQVSLISTFSVSKLIDDLKLQGVQPATLRQVKASLGSAFKKLVASGQISSNPTHGITIKMNHSDIQNVVEPDEFRAIIKHLPTEGAQLFAKFLVATGCRFGEATEVRVKDINFKSGELFVQRRVSDLGTNYNNGVRFKVIDATKSGKKRSLMLSKALLQEIKGYVSAKALSKDDLVFSRLVIAEPSKLKSSRGTKSIQPFEIDGKQFKHGTLYSYTHGSCRCDRCKQAVRDHRKAKAIAEAEAKPYQKVKQDRFINQTSHLPRDLWRNTWNKAIAKSAIGWSPRTHDLRHANATQLLKGGVDVHEVKERLGHQSIKTTERYLHRLRHNQSKASEVVNDFLE